MSNKKYTAVRGLLLAILATALVGPPAWGQTFKVLHSFGNTGDGFVPLAGQVFDAQGNLYGVTNLGGLQSGCRGDGCGTVYQLKPNSDGSWTETVIHAFDGNDGAFPWASPILDSQGNLDGSTYGESYYPDFVYQLMKGSDGTWTESILHQFSGSGDGSDPGELTLDASGNIYGTTSGGVSLYDTGTVFTLNRSLGWLERLLHVFVQYPSLGGAGPYDGITFDANGNLYGTTIQGGTYDRGVVYKLTSQGGVFSSKETVLYDFAGVPDGETPLGVIFGPDGSLYGVTQGGGYNGNNTCDLGCGTVYKLTPNSDGTWTKTVLYAFRGGPHDGATPTRRVTFDQAGNIYGTTVGGGNSCNPYPCGTVFKLTPTAGGHWTESIVYFFTGGLDGYNPDSFLAIDGAGNLYGTASWGGLYQNLYGGVAYEITP